ncbi:hypothetical protein C3920_10655 [Novacetimonas pomaceti]|uniref:Uncharacterized protein n=1 Tax=Novacetimonas pomaceti TaxID=2021998 RepID=A0ABX5P1J3_9PROT|nr:hypothetical protein C3920_10655 [Novacetimonas pomaceti]
MGRRSRHVGAGRCCLSCPSRTGQGGRGNVPQCPRETKTSRACPRHRGRDQARVPAYGVGRSRRKAASFDWLFTSSFSYTWRRMDRA